MTNGQVNLSYIISTRNRLPFLKINLQKLIDSLQPDEEIVVVDGNSTDGAKEYLQQLFDEKKIHQFNSEQDHNQAHGWNKALLMARGTIIKKIIDDDVFCYKAISKCKNFMLLNSQVDVVISNDAQSSLKNHLHIEKHSRLPEFEKWCNKLVPSFTFGDVHMLIRRSALANIGLYDTGFINIDWELSLRISYRQVNMAYYTGYNALSVAHAQTVTSLRNEKLISEQGKKGALMYDYAGDAAGISRWSKIKIYMGKLIYSGSKHIMAVEDADNLTDIVRIYDYYYEKLSEFNNIDDFKFIV